MGALRWRPEHPALSFAGLLRRLRAGAKLTQEELAAAAGVSPRSVSNLERGVNRTAHKDTALLLARALGLTGQAEELFVAAARGNVPAVDVLAAAEGAGRGPGPVTGSPYRGLSAFGERDAAFFFGREAATAQVLERMSRGLAGTGLLVVSGVSGAGKSSLLRAGVLPQVRSGGLAAAPGAAWWPWVVFTPTRAPLDELALRVALLAGTDASAVRRGLEADPAGFALPARQAALARPPPPAGDGDDRAAEGGQSLAQRRLLLVVDQFEELFTQCPEEWQRRAFITALHVAATGAHRPDQSPAVLVVLGLRADFEARCADYPQLAGPVQDRYLVTAMTERQLRMAITEPAKKAGSSVDADLVEVLVTEVRTRKPGTSGAGMLPLLSHALDQAWRSRAGQVLTLADYERTGGIEGAVAASAQRAYERLTPGQQAAARQVFLRLTATSPEGVDSADRATKAELTEGKSPAEAQEVEAVLEAFAAERLLTLAAGTVELSHEALLTAWPLLRDTWLADTHADRIVRTRLHATAADWALHSRDPSYLYSGSLLAAATGTASRIGADPARHPPLSQTERDFLHASSHAHRRTVRRRQAVIAGLLALTLTALAAAGIAARNAASTSHQHAIALSRQLAAESLNIDGTNPVTARRLAAAAWAVFPTGQAASAMTALLAEQQQQGMLPAGPSTVFAVAFSRSGKLLATAGADGTVRLWNTATRRPAGAPIHASARHGVHGVAFSPNGTLLATADGDGTVRLWNTATRRRVGAPLHASGRSTARYGVRAVAFSRDGKLLATGGADGTVRLWNTATRRPRRRAPARQRPVRRVRGGVQPQRHAAGQRRRRQHGAAVEHCHPPPRRRAPPDRLRPCFRRGRGGVQPRRQAAGQRRRRRHRAAVAHCHRPPRRCAASEERPRVRRVRGGVQPRRHVAGRRRRRRHHAAVEPGHRPPRPRAHPGHQPPERRARGGVQPRRHAAGQRPRRRHGAAVEPGHRPPHRRAVPDQRWGGRGGVQPRRQAAGRRRWRRHGAAVGSRHRPAHPRAHPDRLRSLWRRVDGGVQPRRHAAGHRPRRRHRPAVEPGHRPPRRPDPPGQARRTPW